MTPEAVAGILGGLLLLVAGGEALVRGSSNIALGAGLSPLVVGLTVVSFATSAPEFAVTMDAVLADLPGLAVGDVVGSNIANILLVLGLTAVVAPVFAHHQLVRFDVPVLVGISVLATGLAFSGTLQRWNGALLFTCLIGYVMAALRYRGPPPSPADEPSLGPLNLNNWPRSRLMGVSVVMVVAGVGALVAGAALLVDGAESVASALGLSDVIIGVTVVAVGTSLPELATSMVAALRGESDIAVGNVVGSSIFNLGGVLGLATVLSPDGIAIPRGAANFDFFIMTAVAVLLLPVAYTRSRISRGEGIVFLLLYAAFIAYLLLRSQEHDALQPFSAVMVFIAIPLLVGVLVLTVVMERRERVVAAASPRQTMTDEPFD